MEDNGKEKKKPAKGQRQVPQRKIKKKKPAQKIQPEVLPITALL